MTKNRPVIKATAHLVWATQRAYTKKWLFAVVFFAILFTSTGIAATLDLLPNPITQSASVALVSKQMDMVVGPAAAMKEKELPLQLEIPTLKISEKVNNPTATDVETLDSALLSGVVRYPTSARLGEEGNVIIFGHSSYLPVVKNREFKAFNDIETLQKGDTIIVTSATRTYTYAVESVVTADATQDALPLSVQGSKLTLATCDSFGTKSGRFVVTATLVGSNLLGSQPSW
jgi:LPXTG-site transpeptidase (sortase) family protein